MSCKYCRGEEPLIKNWFGWDVDIIRDKRDVAKLRVIDAGGTAIERTIDFCPICGDSLRPFGPAWAHHT